MFNINLTGQHSHDEEKLKFHMDDSQGIIRLAASLSDYITIAGAKRQIIVLCIGTDRSTGDCLGPLVGSKLQESTEIGLNVYGTLDQPVHANNLHQILIDLGKTFPSSFIIAVDACLGRLDSVGYINLSKGPLKPGAGVNKNLPLVGEAHLTGIVNVGGFMEYLVLQNTRLNLVMKLANQISKVIMNAYSIARNNFTATNQ